MKGRDFFPALFLVQCNMNKLINELYEVFLETGSVVTDTRKLSRGSIFFALKGDRFDGNKFAVDALKQGCRMAVVDDQSLKNIRNCLWVPNVLEALQNLARHHRKHLQISVIGITGTNGKTTTKELISAVLSRKYKVWFTRGNLNNHIGVPLTLLSIPAATQIAVVEMGANHMGEISDLCNIALPDHGLITNVGKAHLEGFGSFEGVRKAKGELYAFLKAQGGEIFINVDNHWLRQMVGDYPWIGYGTSPEAVVSAVNASADPLLTFELSTSRVERLRVSTCLTGLYNLENVLAAASVAHYFGIDEASVKEVLESYMPINNRSQFYNTGINQIVLDAYNANPSSMKVALDNFKAIDHSHKILVLGGMKEMGAESVNEHKHLIEQILDLDFSACFLSGPEFEGLLPGDKRFHWYKDSDELKHALKKAKIRNALLLVKGSRANRLEGVVEVL
jgi:UDP-N-acetylmuramoyl-tripeptide--D-alanyl-D-alanine ligase